MCLVIPPDDNSEALGSHLKFTESGEGSWFTAWGTDADYYYDGDALQSDSNDTCLQAIVESDSSETIKFHWKVSCQTNYDYLRFYIDGTLKDSITGEVDWQQKSYGVSAGIHTLKWVYDDGGGSTGDDCGWVDFVQWTGPSPQQDPNNWQSITYKYDPAGRRIEKKVDGYSTRYFHDGGSVIAEYDGNNNLLRKYIAGPDGPVCMIDVSNGNETCYYHYDGSGNVVALSDSTGDTIQTYEYSVYGQVAAEDPNHPNPYMFGGLRFEAETGLYFCGGPVYNPNIGRYLQQNYGIHWEKYSWAGVKQVQEEQLLTFVRFKNGIFGFIDLNEEVPDDAVWSKDFDNIDAWMTWAKDNPNFGFDDLCPYDERVGWEMANGDEEVFWAVQALIYLGYEENFGGTIAALQAAGVTIDTISGYYTEGGEINTSYYTQDSKTVTWNTTTNDGNFYNTSDDQYRQWFKYHPLTALAHELGHAIDALDGPFPYDTFEEKYAAELFAVDWENSFRYKFYKKVPGYQKGDEWEMLPKPQCGLTAEKDGKWSGDVSWDIFLGIVRYKPCGPLVVQP